MLKTFLLSSQAILTWSKTQFLYSQFLRNCQMQWIKLLPLIMDQLVQVADLM